MGFWRWDDEPGRILAGPVVESPRSMSCSQCSVVAFVSAPVASIRLVGDVGHGIWWVGSGLGNGIDGLYHDADTADIEDLERQADLAERRAEAQQRLDDATHPDLDPDPGTDTDPNSGTDDADADPDSSPDADAEADVDGGGAGQGDAAGGASYRPVMGGGPCVVDVWSCCPGLEPDLRVVPDCLAVAFPPDAAIAVATAAHDIAVDNLPNHRRGGQR